MAINKTALKLDARLNAIEFAVCELFSAFYRDQKAPAVHSRHDAWIRYFGEKGTPGYDPAMSDLLAAETEIALRRLLTRVESHAQMPRPMRKSA